MASDDAERDRMRMLMAAAAERTACPPSDILARAVSGEANAAERRAVADHLATCPDCTDEYRVAAALGPWSRDDARSREIADMANAANTTHTIANGANGANRADASGLRTAPFTSRATPKPSAFLRWTWAAAALLVVATTALLMWGLSLRQENARLAEELVKEMKGSASLTELTRRMDSQAAELTTLRTRLDDALTPALNVPIVDLVPRDEARGGPSPTLVRVPANARLVTFVVSVATEPVARDHELEIVGPTGVVLWRGSGLRPNAEKTFTVTVPRALLPAGTCHLRLSVLDNGTRRVVGDYAIAVES